RVRERAKRRSHLEPSGRVLRGGARARGPGRRAPDRGGGFAVAVRGAQPDVPERGRADRAGRARGAPGSRVPGSVRRSERGGEPDTGPDSFDVRRASRGAFGAAAPRAARWLSVPAGISRRAKG